MPKPYVALFQVFITFANQKIVESFNNVRISETISLKVLIFLGIIFSIFCLKLSAQNKLNVGISFAPGYSFTSVDKKINNAKIKGGGTYFNYHLSLYGQFLFKDKFGLEVGLGVATKTASINLPNENLTKEIYLDAFHFPFLLCYKLPFNTTPYKKWLFLGGIVIEYQNNIAKNNLIVDEERSHFVPNISLGSRIDFREGVLGKIQLGISFQYSFKNYFTYNYETEQLPIKIKPRVHFLKLDLVYYFINKDLN